MRNVTFVLIITFAVAAALLGAKSPTQQSNSAEVLLGAALHQEEVEGNLEAAIKTYRKVLAEHPDNRPIAARALLRIGQCYERLGKDEARKAYEQLISDYADQHEQAKLARVRLAALGKPTDVGKDPGFSTRQVWADPNIIGFAGAPSPDGRYLSFVDWMAGGDLAVRDLEAGTNRRLTNKGSWLQSTDFAMSSIWSPDGKQIAYQWYKDEGYICELRVIAREGGKPRTLVDYEGDEFLVQDWSPDGKHILIFLVKRKRDAAQIGLVSVEDGTTRILKTFEASKLGLSQMASIMCFSRDGRYIVYDNLQELNSPERDIFLISVDGGNEAPLVDHPAHDFLLGWMPDREGILFASNRTGSLYLWFLPVSAGKALGGPELVQRGVGQIEPIGFAQNGSYYYTQGRIKGTSDVYAVRMDPQSGEILALPETVVRRFEGYNSYPAYSPDGKHLAYVTARNAALLYSPWRPTILCIRSLETGKEQEFPTEFTWIGAPRWSPNGQFIYLAAWDDRGVGIFKANTQNGEVTTIVLTKALPNALHCYDVSPDGNSIIHGWRVGPNSRRFRILSRDLSTGEEKQLYEGNLATFSISPDGRWLALINEDENKVVQVMPVSGGQPKELLRFEEKDNRGVPIEWTADGKYIIFSRPHYVKDKPHFALWRIAAEGGEPQELNLVMANFQDLSVHPDGQHLAFDSSGFTVQLPAVWVMENILPPPSNASK